MLVYHYDAKSKLVSVTLNGAEYFYMRDLTGTITGLYDSTGDVVIEYNYDSWGKIFSTSDNSGVNLGEKNPFRYKGYYYDKETQLYYLNSRYYNPEWGRFINADSVIGETGGLLTHNLFAYCSNNPVMNSDPSGHDWLSDAWNWFVNDVVKPVVKGCATVAKEVAKAYVAVFVLPWYGTSTVGLNASAAGGAGASIAVGITADSKGNIGVIATPAGGGGTPSASLSLFRSVTSAPTIYDQRGISGQYGGSAGEGVSIGGEYFNFANSKTGETYHGVTVMAGVSAVPAELHGEAGYSFVYGFNIYNEIDNAYNSIVEW